uniref:Uncharacterized protein n=1 Tax=Glossina austeni TaxID=7395 RepID=A0A1A9VFJ6_GLOAU
MTLRQENGEKATHNSSINTSKAIDIVFVTCFEKSEPRPVEKNGDLQVTSQTGGSMALRSVLLVVGPLFIGLCSLTKLIELMTKSTDFLRRTRAIWRDSPGTKFSCECQSICRGNKKNIMDFFPLVFGQAMQSKKNTQAEV